jgi:hypothetical protein
MSMNPDKLLTPRERAYINRRLKRMPHIAKREKQSLLDLFPNLHVPEVVKVTREEEEAR